NPHNPHTAIDPFETMAGAPISYGLRRVCGSASGDAIPVAAMCRCTAARVPAQRPAPRSRLEQRQVAVDLPRRDLLVVGVPLVLLGLHEVVDVVLGARVPERL